MFQPGIESALKTCALISVGVMVLFHIIPSEVLWFEPGPITDLPFLAVALATGVLGMISTHVKYKKVSRLLDRLDMIISRMPNAKHDAELNALLFEAKNVAADIVHVVKMMDNEKHMAKIKKNHKSLSEMFDISASKVKPTDENVKIFQQTLTDLGRIINDK